jgi:hypothetical protein
MAGIFAVNVGPFIELAQRINPLRGRHFSFSKLDYEPFYMSEGMGFLGIGNGLRLGGGGMSGSRHFTSSPYADDSFVNYAVKISWGGFLIEKFVETNKYSYIVGGYLGSGRLKADWVNVRNYTAFNGYDAFDDDDDDLSAFFGYFELHGGLVYHVAQWMHIGTDISLPLLVSSDGFAPYTKEFINISPGLRIRLIFGNLG